MKTHDTLPRFVGLTQPKRRTIFLNVCVLFLCCVFSGFGNALATPIGAFDPSSLSITEITGPRIPGVAYSFDFDLNSLSSSQPGPYVTGASSFGYLNVVSQNDWLIQDQPIPLVSDITGDSNHFWFSSSTGSFSNVFAVLNDTPFGTAPTPTSDWSHVTGAAVTTDWGEIDPAGQDEPAITSGPPPEAVPIIEGYLRGGVPDINQLRNECGPTSTTNSLLWLIKKHKLPTDKLPKKPNGELDEQELLRQLAKAMSPDWNETPVQNGNRGYDGLNGNELVNGKKQYFKDKGLPLVTHGGNTDPKAKGASAFQFVKDELKKGQDVEFLINWTGSGSHWVTVVGFIDAGIDMKTLIVHDPLPNFSGNQYWTLKDDGTFKNKQGTAFWAVAESVPEPSAILLLLVGVSALVMTRGFGYSKTYKSGGHKPYSTEVT